MQPPLRAVNHLLIETVLWSNGLHIAVWAEFCEVPPMHTFQPLRRALPVVFMILCACSGEGDPEPGETRVTEEIPQGPSRSADAGPLAGATETNAIPAQFLGAWDHVEGDCRATSDLRMDVRPREIEFYESIGRVAKVEVEDARTALVTLDMTGEGETWQVTNRFNLNDDGTRLTPEHVGEDNDFEPVPLKKCSGASTDA